MDSNPSTPHDTRNIDRALLDWAKRGWGISLSCKVAATLIGILPVIVGRDSYAIPFIQVGLIFVGELAQLRSDSFRGRGESLKRKIEYEDGFGWQVSRAELSDILAGMSKKSRKRIEQAPREPYFASQQSPGPQRVLENLKESAWWSKNLSNSMLKLCVAIVALLVTFSFILLYVSLWNVQSGTQREAVGKVVSAVISLAVSLGSMRLVYAYWNFRSRSEKIEQSAAQLLTETNVEVVSALKLLHEYQIARASSPPIPTLVWKARRTSLNELWAGYRTGNLP